MGETEWNSSRTQPRLVGERMQERDRVEIKKLVKISIGRECKRMGTGWNPLRTVYDVKFSWTLETT